MPFKILCANKASVDYRTALCHSAVTYTPLTQAWRLKFWLNWQVIIVQLFNLILTYLHYSLCSWLAATVTAEHGVGWGFQPDYCRRSRGRSWDHQWVWLDPFSLYRCLAPNTSPVSLVPGGDASASLPSWARTNVLTAAVSLARDHTWFLSNCPPKLFYSLGMGWK